MKRFVLYGDSLLAQIYKEYLLELEAALGDYQGTNCAVGGFDSTDALARASFVKNLPFDLIIISLGTNDAAPWKKVELDVFEKNIRSLVETFGPKKVIFFLPPPISEEKQTGLRRDNETIDTYRNSTKVILEESGTRYVDSEKLFGALRKAGIDYNDDDGVHLNEKAYEVLFRELARLNSVDA